jgi:hypothetical protein
VAGGGSAITVTDEGGAPLTTDVVSFDFVGTGVTASNVGDDVTITIAAGAAPIDTVFGRTGTVVAVADDYTASEVTNVAAGTIAATDVQAAINELDTEKAASTDARFPTTDEKGALAGTGAPSGGNLFVTADTLAAKTHTLADITDSGTAAAEDIGIVIGDVVGVVDVGGAVAGLPVLDGSQLTGVTAASTLSVEEEGTPVPNGPHDTMNFIGGGVTAADGGGGTVTVTIAPGAAPIDTVFGRTGTVLPVAGDYTAAEVTNVPSGDIAAITVQAAIDELDTDKAAVGHTQVYTTVDGVPTNTLLGKDTAGTGAAKALTPTEARALLNVQDGSVAAGTVGDAYATSHEASNLAHDADEIINDPAGSTLTATNVQTAIDELDTDKAAAVHTHVPADVTGLGTAAEEDVGTAIGDVAQYVNVGGNAGLPAVNGSLLTGITAGADIEVVDESTTLTTALNKLTFTGTGVVASEPGPEGEITVNVTSGGVGVIDITDGTTNVAAADLLTFNGTAFDVVDQGANDALVNPVFGTSAGEISEGDHVHFTLADVAQDRIIGRVGTGQGLSEELTAAQARGILAVSHDNILGGSVVTLKNKISGELITEEPNELNNATAFPPVTPIATDLLLLERADGSKASSTAANLPDNSTPVTLANPASYLSLTGQVLTHNPIDLSSLEVTGDLPVASVAAGTNDYVIKTVAGVAAWAVESGGTTVLTGAVDPTTEGSDGDFYYNTVKRGFWYNDTAVWEEVGVVADDVTVEVDPTNGLQLKGFPAAATNSSPRKTAGGAIEWVGLGGSESNDLATDGILGIADNQLPVGTGAGTAAYATLPTTGAVAFNGTAFAQANATDTLVANTDDRIIGRVTAGAGAAEELTSAQATAMLDEFAKDSSTQGVVPASAGGTTAFLRADGTWVAPAGSGDVSATGTPLITEYARWTDATTIEGRTLLETQTDLGVRVGTDVQAWSAVLDATTASFLVADETKLDGIEASADVTDAVNVAAAGAPITSSGAGAPSSTPAAVGDIYVDTTNDESYIAAGTASSADWKQATGSSGADLDGLTDVTLTAPATDAILIKTAGNWVDGTVNTNSITDDAVTNAKLGTMLANTVKVNNTAGTTNPSDLAVGASTVIGRGAAGDIVAASLATDQITDNAVTLAKIATKTDTNSGVLGYDQNGNPVEVEEGSIGQVLLSQAGVGAPSFGQLGAAAVAPNAIGNVQLTDMAANTVKGRNAATSGDPGDIAIGTNTVLGRVAGDIVAAQVVAAQIEDNAITLAKMAGGTDGELITYDAAGDPAYVATGNLGEVLTSAGAGAAPSFQVLTPAPKTIVIENPVAETVYFFRAWTAMTLTTVRALIQGGTSIPVTLASGTTYGSVIDTHVSAQTALNTTTGANLTIADTTIAAGRNVWLTFGTPVGTQTLITVDLRFA